MTTTHLTTPMTNTEWRFVRSLLRQGDTAAQWPKNAHAPTDDFISTPMTQAFLKALIEKTATFPPDHPLFGVVARQLLHANDAIANRIASDLNPAARGMFTPAEWDVMDLSYHTLNGDPEVYVPGYPCGLASAWAWYYAKKIENLYYAALTVPAAAPEYPPEATPQTNPDISEREEDMQRVADSILREIDRGRTVREAILMAYADGWHKGFADGLSEARQHSR